MSMQFSKFGALPYTHEETNKMREEIAARGATPQVLLKEDFVHREHAEFEELRGSFIEINLEACTDEVYQTRSQGHGLERDNYGTEWRIWTGGIPTQEQMDAAPWEA